MSSIKFNFAGYGSIPNSAALEALANNFSVDCWIKPTAGAAQQIFIHKGIYPSYQFAMVLYSNGSIDSRINELGAFHLLQSAAGVVTFDDWNHIVMTYNGSDHKLYVNGALVASDSHNIPNGPNSHPVIIGRYSGSTNYGFNGSIDELKIWGRELSAAEISTYYSSDTIAQTDLVAYYSMNEGSGAVAADSVSGNDMSLVSLNSWTEQAPGTKGDAGGGGSSVDGIVAMSLGDGDDVVISIGKMDIS